MLTGPKLRILGMIFLFGFSNFQQSLVQKREHASESPESLDWHQFVKFVMPPTLIPVSSGRKFRVYAETSSSSSSADTLITVTRSKNRSRPRHGIKGDIETAIYSYIQVRRALGETTVNTADISRALDLPLGLVGSTVQNLIPKDVRRVG
jgi:hypothetical protein